MRTAEVPLSSSTTGHRWRFYVAPLYLLFLAWWVASGHFSQIAVALISLACHELAHLFVLAGYDVPVRTVELHPFGAMIRYESPATGMGQVDAVVAAAGPLQSFLLAAMGTYIQPFEVFSPERVQLFISFNLLLACFNLIPVWPLDGGRIMRSWLAPRIGDGHAVRVLARAGVWLGLGLMAVGILLSWLTWELTWVPVLMGLFLWRSARPDLRAGQQAIVRSFTRRNRSLPHGIGPVAVLAVREDVPIATLLKRLRSDRYNLIHILDQDGHTLGQVTEDEAAAALLEVGLTATAGQLLQPR